MNKNVEAENETLAAARLASAAAEKKYRAARHELAVLLEARRPLVLGASSDGETSGELSENRTAIIAAEIGCRDAETRLDAARAVLVDAERAVVDAAAEEKLAKAKALAAEIIEASETFDGAVADAANALEKRDRLAMKIRATGCLRAGAAEGLASRSRIRSAFGAAGLHHFLDEFIARRHCQKLAVSDGSLSLQKPTRERKAA